MTNNKQNAQAALEALREISPAHQYRLATDIAGPAYLLLQGGQVVREFTSLAQAAMWLDAKLDTVQDATQEAGYDPTDA